MNIDNRIEMYKEIYNNQIERKDRLKSNLIIPTGITGVFGALTSYFIEILEKGISGFSGFLFFCFFIIFFYRVSKAIYYIYISWKGENYVYFPKSSEVEERYNKLQENDEPEKKFKKYLIKVYITANDRNFKYNKKIRGNLLSIQKNLTYALIFALASLFINKINIFLNLLETFVMKGG